MISAGVDCGAQAVKVVLLRHGRVIASSTAPNGQDQVVTAARCLEEALAHAGLARKDVVATAATGVGRKLLTWAPDQISDVAAAALGAVSGHGAARTVIDVGAEEARAIRCDATGRVLDFALNERCAAGTGAFIDTMARAIDTPLQEMGMLSMSGQPTVVVNAQCAVFAESEVVSLIHARTPRADIARAVCDAIAQRIASLVARVGANQDVVLVGGLARNEGVVRALSTTLNVPVHVPDRPVFVGALGAAVAAQARRIGDS